MLDAPPDPQSDGAALLREYIDTHHGKSIQAFCKAHGMDRVHVQRVLSGELGKRVTVNFALNIADATGGAVPIDAWDTRVDITESAASAARAASQSPDPRAA